MFNRIVFTFISFALASVVNINGQDHSVLATGDWYKIAVTSDGIYRLNRTDLQTLGVNVTGLNPKKLAIYGHGAKLLPQSNLAPRHIDLAENAIEVSGENDGSFDQGDYLLFYGQGPHQLIFDHSTQTWMAKKHYYTDTSYYFLHIGSNDGLRTVEVPADTGGVSVENYDEVMVHELDEDNLLSSGREWFGEKFQLKTDYQIDFNVEGIVSSENLQVHSSLLSNSVSASSMSLSLNGETLMDKAMPNIPSSTYALKGIYQNDDFQVAASGLGENLQFDYRYVPGNVSPSVAFLDQLIITYMRQNDLYGAHSGFRQIASTDGAMYRYQMNSNFSVWEITDPQQVKRQLLSNQEFSHASSVGVIAEFMAFDESQLTAPFLIGQVENQDLRGETVPDMLIVSDPRFLSQAHRLSDFRQNKDGLKSLVVTPKQIYNEFNSGAEDISAIRDFARHLYQKSSKLKYLMLVGDCSYDYKGRKAFFSNLVPTYESRNSEHPIFTFSSDDYYGFLDDDEGEWIENSAGDHQLDIGVGRLPVMTLEETKDIVDKIINYETNPATFGDWRNEVVFVADDGDGNIHQRDARRLAELIDTTYQNYNSRKIYLDSYEQEVRPEGEFSPKMSEAVIDAINDGALIVNYTGHGNEGQWMHERIFELSTIDSLKNSVRLPLFVTATCEFGRFDDPGLRSGAERLILRKRSGAIALVTTTRPVFSSTNYQLNQSFYESVFALENGSLPRLGDVIRKTKNGALSGSLNRNFSLLGDPSMRLAYPGYDINIDELSSGYSEDTLRALETITVKGRVTNQLGQTQTQYDGQLKAIVLDKPQTLLTLGVGGPVFKYEERNSTLFRGKTEVEAGQFEFQFVIPKNINYQLERGKISLYGVDTDSLIDAGGAYIDFFIGGSNNLIPADNIPPEMTLYIGNTEFQTGDDVLPNTTLLARLSDENGINISNEGLGQEIKATLDKQESFFLNNFFESDLNQYQTGWVQFPLDNLAEGTHELTLKAWDTHNNSTEETVEFTVVGDEGLSIRQLINLPNPFRDQTEFRFSHDFIGDDIEVLIDVFSTDGKLLKQIREEFLTNNGQVSGLYWDGFGNNGIRLSPGMYIFKLRVKSLRSQKVLRKAERLIFYN